MSPPETLAASIPRESLARLFLRFLRFGVLAWGGPVAQIAMLRQAFVDDERWVSSDHFNRALALYQVLPGPEAHELCVYFGMLARGRRGGLIAGLGFMLPGFLLMFALSWAYVSIGLDLHGEYAAAFAAIQAAVIALIVRAVHRIGSHVLEDRWLWVIAALCMLGHLLDIHFAFLLAGGGFIYLLARTQPIAASVVLSIGVASGVVWALRVGGGFEPLLLPTASATQAASLAMLFWSGLKAGCLTFGGAYTAIPLVQRDAVVNGSWMSNAQFMDGIAIGGVLPAPLIIFTTFVGYVGGGPLGAIVMTAATFLPAFAITLLAHDQMERLIHETRIRRFLDGVTAAVVGLIAGTAISLFMVSIRSATSLVFFALALAALLFWKSKLVIPAVIIGAGVVGSLLGS